ncbi:protein HflC [Aureimonas endophytica]|uniref:Protein HflC n=1 Tax=Aureimonas endophytica TaxID=2027858 RepID=A0A916ZEE4_9HYPH|nr:protease modulator HflC [Aureimonas endophytica]GGD92005.1 protein HflC [Aureimonas endophytica]
MISNRFYGLLILVVLVLFVVWNALFVVRQGEQAVVLRFGQIQRVLDQPGLYVKMPFAFANADNVQKLPTRLLRSDLTDLRVQVASGAFYEVDAFMVYRITDARKFRQAVAGGQLDVAEQRLLTRFNSAIRATYGRRTFDAALSAARAEMMVEVRDQVRPEAANLGVSLEDVRISRTDLTPEVSERTYARMSAERLAEAERLRADGQVKAREIRAAADREAVTLTAEAQRDAAALEGEGQAERSRVLAEAYGRDASFFDFFRRLEAYRTALGSGTTMMVSPEGNDFFRYFDADGQGGRFTPPAPGATPPAAGATPPAPPPAAPSAPPASAPPAPAPAP